MVFTMVSASFAETKGATEIDTQNLKRLIISVEQYIDFGGTDLFDVEKAMLNNESGEIISIGLVYNELYVAEKQNNIAKVNRVKRSLFGFTHYGNWCGRGDNGKEPIDILDGQCKIHDECYAKNGKRELLVKQFPLLEPFLPMIGEHF